MSLKGAYQISLSKTDCKTLRSICRRTIKASRRVQTIQRGYCAADDVGTIEHCLVASKIIDQISQMLTEEK